MEEPCGDDATCDPVSKTCVDLKRDARVPDAPTSDQSPLKDSPHLTDAQKDTHLQADLPSDLQSDVPSTVDLPRDLNATDASCAPGLTLCGDACVMLSASFEHCGACFLPCLRASANSCVNSQCVCGATGAPCPAGLDCVGGQCSCIAGGRCLGCCSGDTCLALDVGQSGTQCGAGGAQCEACDDQVDCTTNSCESGQCLFPLSPAHCRIEEICYAQDEYLSVAQCRQCLPSVSSSAWTPVPNPGCVTTVAGSGTPAFQDGPAATAEFQNPFHIAVDSAGKIYVADLLNHRIRVISGGQVSTLAGKDPGGYLDGPVTDALFWTPKGVAVDDTGAVYVADTGNNRIRKIFGGMVTTVAGSGWPVGALDGPALTAQFNQPSAVVVDSAGKITVADQMNHRIRVLEDGEVTTLAGENADFADGTVLLARFNEPIGLALDDAGSLYIADSKNHRVRMINGAVVSTLAGSGVSGFLNGAAGSAQFNVPCGVSVGSSGEVYVADHYNNQVRVIVSGTVSTVAGIPAGGYRDGPASIAQFYWLPSVAYVAPDLVYVADGYNHRIRQITLGP